MNDVMEALLDRIGQLERHNVKLQRRLGRKAWHLNQARKKLMEMESRNLALATQDYRMDLETGQLPDEPPMRIAAAKGGV